MQNSDNSISSIKRLLTTLDFTYTTGYLKETVLTHPDYPSLLAISDTLEKYNIETLSIKIDQKKLGTLPVPCIVQVKLDKSPLFYTLIKVGEGTVTYYDNKDKLKTKTTNEFLNIWTGICLLVEMSEDSKEEAIEEKIKEKKVQNILIFLLTVFLISSIVLSFLRTLEDSLLSFYTYGIYFLWKCLGLIASTMLLWLEIDKYNPTLQGFCSGSKKVNCELVLSSKYSKVLTEKLSLSAIGFSYFFGSILYLLTTNFSSSSLVFMGYLSLIMIPVIAFSAYTQAIILKKWCKFCLIIQGVLILEIITVLSGDFYLLPVSLESILIFMVLFITLLLGWMFLKPLLEKERETNLYKRGLNKIKYNPNVLNSLLLKSRKINTDVEELGIIFKSDEAKHDVIKVCSPYCGPCSNAHPVLESLVKKGKINLRIIFIAQTNLNDPILKPIRHFLAIDAQGDKSKTQTALDRWYKDVEKDYDKFAYNYPMNGELQQQDHKIRAMHNWCKAERITHTPTIFINGHEMPNEYTIEDLKEVLN